jgi:putative tricarboxylic transport membrane protein
MLDHLIFGFSVAFTPFNIMIAFLGCLVGTIIGVLPGLGPTGTIAILLPLVFSMPATSALIMLAAVYYGAMYGGSTTSILVNIPGESASVVTTLDGHKMALQGRAGPALAISAVGSFIAGTFSIIVLTFIGAPVASFALRFGPAQFFSLMVFGLSTVASLTGKSVVKAIMATVLGLMMATVGIDLVSGAPRYTFGNPFLLDGIDFIVVAIGMFAISEVIVTAEELRTGKRGQIIKAKSIWVSFREFVYSIGSILRGTVIGFFVGVLPGAGATLASFLSYDIEKRVAKNPERFGQGEIRGVACPESANNAASGGALLPLLTLGIPGGGATAVMLGALMMLDITPGPLLFQKHPELVWGLIASMYLGNLMLLVLNWPLVNLFARIMYIPARYLMPVVLVISTIGVWSLSYSSMDLIIMGICGVVGYYMRKNDYPLAPVLLGLILGGRMEQAFRQALIISRGSPLIFLQKPLSITLLIGALMFLMLPYLLEKSRQLQLAREGALEEKA